MKKKKSDFRPNSLWTLPSAGLLLFLTVIPLIMLLVFSFMNRNLFAGQPWPGWTLKNITRMFNDTTFWNAVGTTFEYALWKIVLIITAKRQQANSISRQ